MALGRRRLTPCQGMGRQILPRAEVGLLPCLPLLEDPFLGPSLQQRATVHGDGLVQCGWPQTRASNGPNSRIHNGPAVSSAFTTAPLLLLRLAFNESFGC